MTLVTRLLCCLQQKSFIVFINLAVVCLLVDTYLDAYKLLCLFAFLQIIVLKAYAAF